MRGGMDKLKMRDVQYGKRHYDMPLLFRAGEVMFCAFGRIADFIDRRQIIRRGAFVWMLVLTTDVVRNLVSFSMMTARPGLEVAAILAAILTPLATLQGFIFKFYDQAQKDMNGAEGVPPTAAEGVAPK
jgi:hypothetical protein